MSLKKWSKPWVAELDILRTEGILGKDSTNDILAALLLLIDGHGHHHANGVNDPPISQSKAWQESEDIT